VSSPAEAEKKKKKKKRERKLRAKRDDLFRYQSKPSRLCRRRKKKDDRHANVTGYEREGKRVEREFPDLPLEHIAVEKPPPVLLLAGQEGAISSQEAERGAPDYCKRPPSARGKDTASAPTIAEKETPY